MDSVSFQRSSLSGRAVFGNRWWKKLPKKGGIFYDTGPLKSTSRSFGYVSFHAKTERQWPPGCFMFHRGKIHVRQSPHSHQSATSAALEHPTVPSHAVAPTTPTIHTAAALPRTHMKHEPAFTGETRHKRFEPPPPTYPSSHTPNHVRLRYSY